MYKNVLNAISTQYSKGDYRRGIVSYDTSKLFHVCNEQLNDLAPTLSVENTIKERISNIRAEDYRRVA